MTLKAIILPSRCFLTSKQDIICHVNFPTYSAGKPQQSFASAECIYAHTKKPVQLWAEIFNRQNIFKPEAEPQNF